MKFALPVAAAGVLLLGLAGCTVAPPSGPTVVAMPGQGVAFDTFQKDDDYCRYYASQHTGSGGGANAASQSATNTAIGGTLLGTAAGALLGAAGGNAGMGAAIGAGSGLLLGSAAAGGNAQGAADSLQAQYNVAYAQCMVGHGNKMEGYAGGPGPSYGYGAPAYAPPGYYAAPGY
ncbi:MAG: glycine zipper family protein [Acidiphilium sp.]|nr:glycine zipper family protein [Acidiphilium sp.]MDD4934865.1 glycine zipper family protein [Acidiphilium sp.]